MKSTTFIRNKNMFLKDDMFSEEYNPNKLIDLRKRRQQVLDQEER